MPGGDLGLFSLDLLHKRSFVQRKTGSFRIATHHDNPRRADFLVLFGAKFQRANAAVESIAGVQISQW